MQDDGGMPCSFWGRVKKSAAFGSKLSCLVETSSSDFHKLAVDLRATKDSASLQVTGSVTVEEKKVEEKKAQKKQPQKQQPQKQQADFVVQTVKLSQSIVDPLFGGRFTVTPRYNIPKNKADITTSYGLANTFVTLDANLETQKLSVSQVLKGVGSIKPSIDTNGHVEIQYTRPFASGSLTANYKHADSLALTYEQGSLVATVVAPPLQELFSSSGKPQDLLKFTIRKAVYLADWSLLRLLEV